MCGRYTLQKSALLADRFEVKRLSQEVAENYNVAPGQIMPVIINEQDERKLELMRWGLIPAWAKDPSIGYKLINARAESLFEKPMWKGLIKRKRALIPADGFYEWQAADEPKAPKQPFYIRPKDEGLFAFAGLHETWHDASGSEIMTYSIITTSPNDQMANIHNRMPVILHQDQEALWLDPALNDEPEAIKELLKPYEDQGLILTKVSSAVNSPKHNDPSLVYELSE